jgi:multiple sugar transport system substrate-binding protein
MTGALSTGKQGRITAMSSMSRRTAIRGALTTVTTAALARPYLARAASTTAVAWVVQGFVPEEDAAFRKTVAEYQKQSGNTIDFSIMPFTALNQKAISALTSGSVPDLIFHDAPATILPQNAWNDRLVDMSDVVEAQKSVLSETAVLASSFYNSVSKQRSYYLAPVKQACAPMHIWGDLVAKAGFKLSEAPKTWDAYWDFFKPVQTALRAKGMRKLYALGLQMTTVGPNDGNNVFSHFMIANGGQNIVTRDGRLHTDDPVVREAAIRAVEYMTTAYKQGFVPAEALTWNDADDNNAYHEKLFVMDFDGTLSTELAMIKDKKAYYDEMVVMGLPNRNDGTMMPAQVGAGGGFIPKGAQNVEVAKDFMRYFMQPQVMNENLKGGLGRWVPVIPSIVREDPWWTDPKSDPHRLPYVTEAVLNPTIPSYNGFNPAWGQVSAEQLWGQAHADVIKNGLKPADAVDKAFRRAETIFAKFTFG